MAKLRCKICLGIQITYPTKPWELTWPKGLSPLEGGYGHKNTRDCGFHQGKTEAQLKADPSIEVLEA